jgi:hypothetical protein
MQMKHNLKQHFLDTETFLKHFMKTQGISYDQFQKDMETFEDDAKYLIDLMQASRIVLGIDVYPYLYVLHKIKKREADKFIRYFTVMANKHVLVDEILEPNIDIIIPYFTKEDTFLYFVAAIQYYYS